MTPVGEHNLSRVSAIVPVHDHVDLLRACLRSVPGGVEVVVVDDCSSEDVIAIRDEFPSATVLRNDTNLGFGATANKGLRVASRPVRVVLNSDARLRPGALEKLVDAFDDPRVGIAGPCLVFPDGSPQTSAAAFPTAGRIVAGAFLLNDAFRFVFPHRQFPWALGMARRDHAFDHDVDWVMGTCLAIRAECVEDTGGFDESYFLYVEETDLCWRATRAGWRVRYVAGAVVEHVGGGSTGQPGPHARRLLDSEARFMMRAYGPRSLPGWRRARLIGSGLKVLALAGPAIISRRARARLRWQWAALAHMRQWTADTLP